MLTVASKGAYSWMVHESGVMRCYDHRTGKFVRQENFLQGRLAKGAQVLVCMLDNGDFWLVWNYGGGFYSNAVNTWTELPLSAEHFEEIAALDVDRSGSAWIGTSGQGIYIVDRHTLMICRVNSFNADLRELNVRGGVHSIYCDNYSGTVWIGMFNQGLAFHHPSMYNPQIQISAESETKRSIFRKRDKTKRSKKESAQHSKSRNKSFVMTSVSAL